MKRIPLVGLVLASVLSVFSCTEEDNQTIPKPKPEPDCSLSVYAASGKDIIYKACNYIERCDQSIYTMYSSAEYSQGLIDECYCNRYMNEILDKKGNDSEAYNAYQDLVSLIDDPLTGECKSNVTGIVKAKVKKFFD